MERRAYDAPLDPALAVSRLLARLGLFLLVVFAPFLAMISRRGVAIIVPIATVLLIIAAALDGRLGGALRRFGGLIVAPHSVALLVLIVWSAVTILWTPQPGVAAGRLPSILLTYLLFVAATACVKDLVRLSDVNLIPIGVSLAALALAFEFLPGSPLHRVIDLDIDGTESQRAAMLLALLVWPAVGSLLWKNRMLQALALGLVTILALWLVRNLLVFSAFIAGTLAFLLAMWRPRMAPLVVGGVSLVLLAFAPLAGWLMARYGGFLLPREGDALVGVWRDVTYALPSHLLAGFGFDASSALARGANGELLSSPRNAALQIWLELGLVGVIFASATIALTYFATSRIVEKHRPAVLAVFASASVMMYSGLAAWQTWWLTTLGLTSISLTFVSRLAARPTSNSRER